MSHRAPKLGAMFRHDNSEFAIRRLSELEVAQRRKPSSERAVERIRAHCDDYLQIESDNPSLIWLLSLMLEEKVILPDTTIVSAMKQAVLAERRLGPLAWRLLANGTASDFRIVLNAEVTDEPQPRWSLLCTWLELLSGLQLKAPIPEPIQALFLHDNLAVLPEGKCVHFRGTWMKFGTLKKVLNEAEARLAQGTLEQFAKTELPEVLVWLATVDPELDTQQVKAGWNYLRREAARWKLNSSNAAALSQLTWSSPISAVRFGLWSVVPIANAWSLLRLAIAQRHCVNRFLDACLRGDAAIFAVENNFGKTVATIMLCHEDSTWMINEVKGFANSKVSNELEGIARLVASRCNFNENRTASALTGRQHAQFGYSQLSEISAAT